MFNIEEYLRKFGKEFKDAELHKAKILEIIEKNTGLYILPKNTEVKDYVLHIQDSPAVKNKIFIYKEKIIKEITKEIPEVKIIDIR